MALFNKPLSYAAEGIYNFAFEDLEESIIEDASGELEMQEVANDASLMEPAVEALARTADLMNFALSQESHDKTSYGILCNALEGYHIAMGFTRQDVAATYALEEAASADPAAKPASGGSWTDKVKERGAAVLNTVKEAIKKAIAWIANHVGKIVGWFSGKSSVQAASAKIKSAYEYVKGKVTPGQDSKLRVIGRYLAAAGKIAAMWAKIGVLWTRLKTSSHYKDGAAVDVEKLIEEARKANPGIADKAVTTIREKNAAIAKLVAKYTVFTTEVSRLQNAVVKRTLSVANMKVFDLEVEKAVEEASKDAEKTVGIFERAWGVISKAFEAGVASANTPKALDGLDDHIADMEKATEETKAMAEEFVKKMFTK